MINLKKLRSLLEDNATNNFGWSGSSGGNQNPVKGNKKKDNKKKGSDTIEGKKVDKADVDTDVNTADKDLETAQTKAPPIQQPSKEIEPNDKLDPEDKVQLGSKTPVIIDPTLADTANNVSDNPQAVVGKGKKLEQDKESKGGDVKNESVQVKKKKAKTPTEVDDITTGVTNEDILARVAHKTIRKIIHRVVSGKKKIPAKGKVSANTKPPVTVTKKAPVKDNSKPEAPSPEAKAHAQSVISGKVQHVPNVHVMPQPKPKAVAQKPVTKKPVPVSKKSEKHIDIPDDPAKIKELLKKGALPVRARKANESTLHQLQLIKESQVAKHSSGGGKRRVSVESDHIDHPVESLRKVVSLGSGHISHKNGEKTEISRPTAHKFLGKYDTLKKPHEKEEFVRRIHHSKQSMEHYMAGHAEKKEENKYSKLGKDFYKRLQSVPDIGSSGGISA